MTTDERDRSDGLRLAPVREGEMIAQKYLAGGVLGVGGMGVVIAATDKLLDRKVAIKFLLPSLADSDRAVRRFIHEARAATRITSEHVVRLLEIDTLPTGMPYFVMEYLEGQDLRALLAQGGPLPLARAADYLLQALEAVAEGHVHGVVHRDIKPSNLFLTKRADGTSLVKVLDFGIAKRLDVESTSDPGLTGSDDVRLGSPAYMSPEQLQRPTEVTARTDVWSLGVTLYELVCGKHPFRGKTYPELILSITTTIPDPPSKHRPELPAELDHVILRCLDKDGARRYENAAELAAALEQFGTERARDSLRRIKGLGGSTAEEHEPFHTTTLPVAAPSDPPTDPGSFHPPISARGARRPATIALAVAGLLAAGGGLFWIQSLATREPAAAPHATAKVTLPELPPVVEPPRDVGKVELAATPARARTATAVGEVRAPGSHVQGASVKAPSAARAVTSTAAVPAPAAPAPAVRAPAVPAPVPAVPAPVPSASSEPGARSAVIEKLIEKRY